MPYRWDDNYGARLGVLRRDDPFGEVRWFEIDPCYVFHVANAYDSTAIPLCCRRSAIRNCGGTAADSTTDGVLWSWTIDLQTGTVTERQLDDRAVEFPRIDDRLAGLPARYAVSVGDGRLVRYDLTTGGAVEHAFGTAESPGGPGEAVFVPSTSGSGRREQRLVPRLRLRPGPRRQRPGDLDASDFAGKPVARIKLPHRVPYGFHGNWISA